MAKKKTIRELYFYKKEGTDLYAIDIVNGRNEHIHKALTNKTRLEILEILENIQKGKHSTYTESKKGMKIFNRFPKDKLMSYTPDNIVNTYLENLKELQESDESRVLAANLLHAAADLLSNNDNYSVTSEIPDVPPISEYPLVPEEKDIIPFKVINYIQEKLDTTIIIDSLIFWFDGYHWKLEENNTLNRYSLSSSESIRILERMSNLLGSLDNKEVDIFNGYLKFNLFEKSYKISSVYSSD